MLSKRSAHRLTRTLQSHFLTRFLSTMATPKKYDCIIVGSGQSGTPLASAFAKAGHKTALIEKQYIGGCCVNVGCTPTKTLIASGRVAHLVRRGKDYGVHVGDGRVEVDMLRVRQRKRDIVNQFRGGGESRAAAAGVEILMGEASFTGPKTLTIRMNDGKEIAAEGALIFLNTGERPAPANIPGIESVDPKRVLDSTTIQELDQVPENLVVVGGGYVGLEFAQLFRRLGSQVTVIQRGKQLLPREDADVAEEMLKILRDDGLTIYLEAATAHITSSDATPINLTCRLKDGTEKTVSGSHLLMAAGRIPNSNMLNLEAAGITTNSKGYIVASETLETTVPGVFVLGDVKGPPAFTHISYDDFRIIRANQLEKTAEQLTTVDRIVPYVVYTDPQLGHVGLHEREARALAGRRIKVAKMPMAYVARALETDESRGMMKGIIDAETSEILGFTCLGIEGGEIMSLVQIAMMGKVKYQSLQNAVFAHPALAESLNNLWGFLE